MTGFPMLKETLPHDHLERLFGRDLHSNGWQIDVPAAANDDMASADLNPMLLLSLAKRRKR